MSRPSPSESATKYDEYTIKQGNDGDMWITMEGKSGIMRWVKICTIKNKKINEINMKIISKICECNANTLFKLLGKINVCGKLTMGDSLLYTTDDFNDGNYYIYTYCHSLIASKTKLTNIKSISSKKFHLCANVTADAGAFAFRTSITQTNYKKYVKNLSKSIHKNLTSKKDINVINNLVKNLKKYRININVSKRWKTDDTIFNYRLPFMKIYRKTKDGNNFVIHRNDIVIDDNDLLNSIVPIIRKNFNEPKNVIDKINGSYQEHLFGKNDIIAIAHSTGHGDGYFPVLCDQNNKIIIQCGGICVSIISAIEDAIADGIGKIEI